MKDDHSKRRGFVTTYGEWLWDNDLQKYRLVRREGYEYDGPWALAHTNANFVQQNWRFRYDDGTLSTATFAAAENTAANSNQFSAGDKLRIRFNIGDDNNADSNNSGTPTLQYRYDTGGGFVSWANVPTSGGFANFASSDNSITDGTNDSTQRLSAIAGSTYQGSWNEYDDNGSTTSRTHTDDYYELEYCVQLAALTEGYVFEFRLLDPTGNVPDVPPSTDAQLTVASAPLTASGTPNAPTTTASGTAVLRRTLTASGTPNAPTTTASGTAVKAPLVWLNSTATLSGATQMTATAYDLNPSIQVVNSASFGDASVGTSSSDTHGFTLQNGDVIIACVALNTDSVTISDNNGANAFTPVTARVDGTTCEHRCFYWVVDDTGDTAFDWTYGSSVGRGSRVYLQLRGVDTTDVISGTPTTGSGGSVGAAGAVDGPALALSFGTEDAAPTAGDDLQWNTGYTEIIEQDGTAGQSTGAASLSVTSGQPPAHTITGVGGAGVHTHFAVNVGPQTITFTDPSGAPTGSGLWLGVENREAGGGEANTGWIQVTVTAAGTNASGTPTVTATTASGTARLVLEASGTPSTAVTTASGTAGNLLQASGTPSTAETTATGFAGNLLEASGTPSTAETTASGTATATTPPLTASGNATAPTTTASGTAGNLLQASGTPSTAEVTASGTAGNLLTASGTPDAPTTTASGTATLGPLTASGAPSAPTTTASGTADAVALPPLTASGTPTVAETTASGTAGNLLTASGTPSAPTTTASGVAGLAGNKSATGNATTAVTTAAGTATLGPLTASGTPTTEATTASGTAALGALTASGTPSTDAVTAAGTATLGPLTASGTPSTDEVTAAGTATLGPLTASGTPSAPTTTASGVAGFSGQLQASGSPSTEATTAAGTATLGPLQASGTPSTAPATASGTSILQRILSAYGTPQAPTTIASGIATGPVGGIDVGSAFDEYGEIDKQIRKRRRAQEEKAILAAAMQLLEEIE